jgi:hypothetical protein
MKTNTRFGILAVLALTLSVVAAITPVASAQTAAFMFPTVESVNASASSNTTDQTCVLIKYVGTTAGKPTVEVAAGGDMTLKIAGSADATTGCASGTCPNSGVFDLSTPHASIDTMGELVNLINTTGSNWRAVLVGCLAADLTDNTLTTFSAVEAGGPKGVALTRDGAVASATSIFSAQVALVPQDAASNIAFWLSGSPIGGPRGTTKVNPNPFANRQTFVQHIREKITSSGTVALLEVIAAARTYDASGQVSETTRVLYAETGANTTVEKVVNFHNGPLVTAPGELVIVRQRTATDLSAAQIAGNGFTVYRK